MPRLEVESVADMKVLFEIGALTPDMSLQLSHIMMGEDIENKRRRIQLERGRGQQQQGNGKGQESMAMRPEDVQSLKGSKEGKEGKETSKEKDKGKETSKEKDKSDPKKHPPPLGGKK
jgi:hypothetical protein